MDRTAVLEKLAEHKAELERLGVSSLAVFGSVARHEARADSDVDLLVEFTEPVGFFQLHTLKERLEQILSVRVDLVTRASLKPHVRTRVLAEAVSAT